MKKQTILGIEVNDSFCGRCTICSSLCPYDAISVDPDNGKVEIDTERCQFCGICYSACPVNAIETVYYDFDTLLGKVEKSVNDLKVDTLVLMCRGNSPPTCEINDVLGELSKSSYIPLRIPCVGRVPSTFILKVLTKGITKIIAIRCEEDFCRFEEGSRIGSRRLKLTKRLLKEMGIHEETLQITEYSRKALYDTNKCVGCDKCVFICPFEAIEAEAFATPTIITDKCTGCGACAIVCPHLAIQLEGFEYEIVSKNIQRLGSSAQKLRAQGISPVILIFCCQWSEFSALDIPQGTPFKEGRVIMEIPCFKGLDPNLTIEALNSGFDGAIAFVCSEEDCKIQGGYDLAERNLDVLQRVLKQSHLEEKFEIHVLSPRKVGDFENLINAFTEKLRTLPPPYPKSKIPTQM
jgi:coenzyme F420-reducing hydrogenase delta subunit